MANGNSNGSNKKPLTGNLLAAHVGINAPHFKNSRFHTFSEDFELFSTPVSHADNSSAHDSALSPAAYFVDLVRLLEKHIGDKSLRERRPDLWQLPLDREHAEDLVPFLEIANNVLRSHLLPEDVALETEDLSEEEKEQRRMQLVSKSLATEQYPFNMPFHMPLLQIRTYLKHFGVDLAGMLETFGQTKDSPAWATEALGLAPYEREGLAAADSEGQSLSKAYGLPDIESHGSPGGLDDVKTFLKQTGLTADELAELLHVSGLGLELDAWEKEAVEPQRIKNLDLATLDFLNRFIRLRGRMAWSFGALNWALQSISGQDAQTVEDKINLFQNLDLARLAQIKQLSEKYELQVDEVCSFLREMNTTAEYKLPHEAPAVSLFDQVFNTTPFNHAGGSGSVPYHPQGPGYAGSDTSAIEWDSTAVDKINQGLRSSLLAALEIDNDDLQAIVDHLANEALFGSGTVLTAELITLDVPNLTRFYRFSKMAAVLSLKVPAYLVLLSCLTGAGEQRLSVPEITGLEDLQTVTYWGAWLQDSKLSPYQLQYLTTGEQGAALPHDDNHGWQSADIDNLPQMIKATLQPWAIRPGSFALGTIPHDAAESIYEALLADSLVNTIETGKSPMGNDRLGLVRHDSIITNQKVLAALKKSKSSAQFLVFVREEDLKQQLNFASKLTNPQLAEIIKQLKDLNMLDSESTLVLKDQDNFQVDELTNLSSLFSDVVDGETKHVVDGRTKRTAIKDLLLRKAGAVRTITNILNEAREHQTQATFKQFSAVYKVDSSLVESALNKINREGLSIAEFAIKGELQDVTFRLTLAKMFDLSAPEFEALLNDLPLIIEPLHGIEPPEGPELPADWKNKLPFLENNAELFDFQFAEKDSETWMITATDWRNRGILNIAPQVTKINDVALSPDGAVVLAACGAAGLWRSGDDGRTWQPLNSGLEEETVLCLAISSDEKTLFVGTENGRIFQASDPSKFWQMVHWTLAHEIAGGNPVKLLATTADGKTLYCFAEDKLFRGFQIGGTWPDDQWRRIDENLQNTAIRSLAVSPDGQAIFIHNSDGIFRWPVDSDNWTKILTYNEICLFATPGGETIISYHNRALFSYTKKGKNWSMRTNWVISGSGLINHLAITPDGRTSFAVITNKGSTQHIIGKSRKLFEVRQEGENFRISWPDPLDTLRTITEFSHLVRRFEKNGQFKKESAQKLAAFLRQQADRSALSELSGWEESQFQALQCYFEDTSSLDINSVKGLMTISRCFDLAAKLGTDMQMLLRFCQLHQNSAWLELDVHTIQKENSWRNLPWDKYNSPQITSLALTPDGKTLFAGTKSDISRLKVVSGRGAKWEELTSLRQNLQITALNVTADGKRLFAGSRKGVFVFDIDGQADAEWQLFKSLEHRDISALAITPDGKTLFAGILGVGAGFYGAGVEAFSIDDEPSALWPAISGLPYSVHVTSLAVTPDSKTLFVGHRQGAAVFEVDHDPYAELVEFAGLKEKDVMDLVLAQDGRTLFAGTYLREPEEAHVFIFDVGNDPGRPLRELSELGEKNVTTLALAPNGQTLFVGTLENGLFIYKFENGYQMEMLQHKGLPFESELLELKGLPHKQCAALVVAPDGRSLFAGFGEYIQSGGVFQFAAPSAFDGYWAAARDLLGVVKSKHAADEWENTIRPVREQLLEQERDALAALLLYKLGQKYPDKAFNTLQDLSDFLLIDVQMSGCADTSYLKEAIGCLQIYIERCRLHAEEGVALAHDQIPESLWAWMGHYRMWEANRKVFFYPENYLEPDLRRQATPLFKELSSELLQIEITAKNVTKAYNNYFAKLEDLSRLIVVSSYYATVGRENRLYIFARSHTSPPEYYYQTAVIEDDRERKLYQGPMVRSWSAWQKIDLTINAPTMSAVHAFERLFIFWVEQKKETETITVNDDTSRVDYIRATVKYSFENVNGQWVHPQTVSALKELDIAVDEKAIKDTIADIDKDLTKIYDKLAQDTKHVAFLEDHDLSQWWDKQEHKGSGDFDIHTEYWNLTDSFTKDEFFTKYVRPEERTEKTSKDEEPTPKTEKEKEERKTWSRDTANEWLKTKIYEALQGTDDGWNYERVLQRTQEQPFNAPQYSSWRPLLERVNETIESEKILAKFESRREELAIVLQEKEAWGIKLSHITEWQTRPDHETDPNWNSVFLVKMLEKGGNPEQILIVYGEGKDKALTAAREEDSRSFFAAILNNDLRDQRCHIDINLEYNYYRGVWIDPINKNLRYGQMRSLADATYGRQARHMDKLTDPENRLEEGLLLKTRLDSSATVTAVGNQPGWSILRSGADQFLLWPLGPQFERTSESLSVEKDSAFNNGERSFHLSYLGDNIEMRIKQIYDQLGEVTKETRIPVENFKNRFASTEQIADIYLDLTQLFLYNEFEINYLLPAASAGFEMPDNWLAGKIIERLKRYELKQAIQNTNQDLSHELEQMTNDALEEIKVTVHQAARDMLLISEGHYEFTRLGSSTIDDLTQKMFAGGVERLLNVLVQYTRENKFSDLQPVDMVNGHPEARLDFRGALGIYFWEIFFYVPWLIADALNRNQQFDQARTWYQYILDPTREDNSSQRLQDYAEGGIWRFLPFRDNTIENLTAVLNDPAHQDELVKDAFDPHALAQTRPGAYEKAVAMKYLDNLLDWGDMLFAQDSWETINQAVILYVRVLNLLGPKPQVQHLALPKEAQSVQAVLDDATHVALLDIMPSAFGSYNDPFYDITTFFSLSENEEFAAYWDRAQDRLYKVRHCLNIQGVRRQLALFQPPIDPRILIRALAAGQDLSSAAAQLSAPVPHYRFSALLRQAKNLTATVVQLGAALLSALEKKAAEDLNLLRSTHEQAILKNTQKIKEAQVEEGKQHLEALQHSLDAAAERKGHYDQLIKSGYSAGETAQITMESLAIFEQTGVALLKLASIPAYSSQLIVGPSSGPTGTGDALMSVTHAWESAIMALQQGAGLAGTLAQFERRQEDWELQQALAGYDVQQITAEIEGARARQTIQETDLEIHELSMEQARAREEFFLTKFNNQELYQWMAGRLATVYFQTYRLAVDLARSAEKAYQYERHSNQQFIDFGLWDNQAKGLLAGEGLMLSLDQLEKAYIDGNARELEIEKIISLLQLDPRQLLDLKRNGKCTFELNEQLFDYDFPGHYCRRIKSISISIPAVVGPNQNIQATLIQKGDRVLMEANKKAVTFLLTGKEQENIKEGMLRSNWRPFQQIAISKGLDDSGLFELNFHDERYLPFEGTGALSTWELSLPKGANRSLDFTSISDVIIKLRYTALDGGDFFRQKVTNEDKVKQFSGCRLFSLRQEFSSDWRQFLSPTNAEAETKEAASLSFNITAKRLALSYGNFTPAGPVTVYTLWHTQPENWQLILQPQSGQFTDPFTINKDTAVGPDAQKLTGKWRLATADQPTLAGLAGLVDVVFIIPFSGELTWD